MKEALLAIVSELKRRRANGEDSIELDEDSFNRLMSLARKIKGDSPVEEPEAIEFAKDVNLDISQMQKKETSKPKKLGIESASFKIAPIPQPTPFKLPAGDKSLKWNALREIVLNDSVCKEHLKADKKIVFGVGSLDAEIFFCGEAPGADEEIQGIPFVGRAGQLLTKIISAMGLDRDQVYISNIMNWRPELPTKTGNRPPTVEEMGYCFPYLKAQIEIVKPKVVVALGLTALNGLLGYDINRKLGASRGRWLSFEGIDLMATYHPSFLLQYASPQKKRMVWEDMMMVMERVGLPISEKQKGYFLPK